MDGGRREGTQAKLDNPSRVIKLGVPYCILCELYLSAKSYDACRPTSTKSDRAFLVPPS